MAVIILSNYVSDLARPGEGAPCFMRGVCTKGQYTTAWPVDNLIISGLTANNNYNGMPPHILSPSKVCFFLHWPSFGVAFAFLNDWNRVELPFPTTENIADAEFLIGCNRPTPDLHGRPAKGNCAAELAVQDM